MDSYLMIAHLAADQTMRQRVAACAAQHGVERPDSWAQQQAFAWAAEPGWAAAWASAIAAGITDPGADESVITDGMILAAVQNHLVIE